MDFSRLPSRCLTPSPCYTPTARDIATRVSAVYGFRVVRSGERYRTVAVCHHGDSPDSLSIRDRPNHPGWYDVKCFSGSCGRVQILDALEATTGWTLRTRRSTEARNIDEFHLGYSSASGPDPKREHNDTPTRSNRPQPDMRAIARRLWARAKRVPAETNAPARRWLASRNLWYPEVPLPIGIRWATRQALHQPAPEVVGAVLCAYAPPREWERAYPNAPEPHAVEIRALNADGLHIHDRIDSDPDKKPRARTYGSKASGRVCILGDPRPDVAPALTLVEGLTDALAFAAREPDSAAIVGGTGGLDGKSLAPWLANWRKARLIADRDAPGLNAALDLRTALMAHRIPIRLQHVQPPYTDYADWAVSQPSLKLTPSQLSKARNLARHCDHLSRHEAARLSVQTIVTEMNSP